MRDEHNISEADAAFMNVIRVNKIPEAASMLTSELRSHIGGVDHVCADCKRSCDPTFPRCPDCEEVLLDATGCPTCGCPNTGGDTCDGCDDLDREEAGA